MLKPSPQVIILHLHCMFRRIFFAFHQSTDRMYTTSPIDFWLCIFAFPCVSLWIMRKIYFSCTHTDAYILHAYTFISPIRGSSVVVASQPAKRRTYTLLAKAWTCLPAWSTPCTVYLYDYFAASHLFNIHDHIHWSLVVVVVIIVIPVRAVANSKLNCCCLLACSALLC